MKGTIRPFLLLGGMFGLAYIMYRTLLTDQAQADLIDCVREVSNSWDRLSDAVGLSPDDNETERFAAQIAAQEQWKHIGY